MITKFNIRTW